MIVYTCLVGENGDKLSSVNSELSHVCFTDKPIEADGWEVRPLLETFDDPVKTARFHKTIGMNLLGEDTLWQDAKVSFVQDPINLVTDRDISLFLHPKRDCIYQEGRRVLELSKATPEDINRQLAAYNKLGFSAHSGLYETCVVFRKHNPSIMRLNELWWQHISQYSKRDQISLPFVVKELGIEVDTYPYGVWANHLFKVRHHPFSERLLNEDIWYWFK